MNLTVKSFLHTYEVVEVGGKKHLQLSSEKELAEDCSDEDDGVYDLGPNSVLLTAIVLRRENEERVALRTAISKVGNRGTIIQKYLVDEKTS